MTKMASDYMNNYAESFAIFAKYEPSDNLDLDYGSIGVSFIGPVTPEDDTRLQELGWTKDTYLTERGWSTSIRYYKNDPL
jgi:hypothetical protein